MARYRLHEKALADLERIYEFGVNTFGLEQADKYYDGLISRLQAIANNPEHAQTVDHVWPGIRRSVYGSHSVYYLVSADEVRIVRILGSEDISNVTAGARAGE